MKEGCAPMLKNLASMETLRVPLSVNVDTPNIWTFIVSQTVLQCLYELAYDYQSELSFHAPNVLWILCRRYSEQSNEKPKEISNRKPKMFFSESNNALQPKVFCMNKYAFQWRDEDQNKLFYFRVKQQTSPQALDAARALYIPFPRIRRTLP